MRSFTESDLPDTDNIVLFENNTPINEDNKTKIRECSADWSD